MTGYMLRMTAIFSLTTIVALAAPHGSDTQVTWLSYVSSYGMDSHSERSSQICFVVFRNGQYRFSKHTVTGIVAVEGKLSDDQLSQIDKMVNKLDFKKENLAKVVRRGSESLLAEVSGSGGGRVRAVWTDPDHKEPFPEAVTTLVDWLQTFKAEPGAHALTDQELRQKPICPPAFSAPLQ